MSEQTGLTLSHGIAAGIGAALIAIGRALWGALQKSLREERDTLRENNAELKAELKAVREERERERQEHQETLTRLGKRWDDEREGARRMLAEERAARGIDAQRMALAIARRASPEDAPRLAETWQEAPTGVHSQLDLVAQALSQPIDAATERRLRRYADGDPLSTPPEAAAQRPKLPPRPR